jgi:DNA-binding GntR family transcriptional regulator
MRDSPLLADLQPPERRVLHEQVLEQLLNGLRNGQLRPGERLLEVEIATRLGLSRGTVREAIRRLEQDGLVVSQPHRGTFVVEPTAADVAEVYSLRLMLEGYAVRLACPRLTPAMLAELAGLVEAMAAAAEQADQQAQLRHDQRFHAQLCRFSGHRHLYETWARLALKLWLVNYSLRPDNSVGGRDRALVHWELIELLQRGAAEAAADWVERHIARRAREVVERVAAQQSGAPVADIYQVVDLALHWPAAGPAGASSAR